MPGLGLGQIILGWPEWWMAIVAFPSLGGPPHRSPLTPQSQDDIAPSIANTRYQHHLHVIHQAPGTKHQAPSTRYHAQGKRYQVPLTQPMMTLSPSNGYQYIDDNTVFIVCIILGVI